MIVDNFGAFGGEWEDWCASKFGNDPTNLAKCNSKPMGFVTLPPWTDVGALQRGIPKPGSVIVDTFGPQADSASIAPPPSAPSSSSSSAGSDVGDLFGVPKKVLLIGAGVLAVGVLAIVLTKPKGRRKFAGYRRRRRSSRR